MIKTLAIVLFSLSSAGASAAGVDFDKGAPIKDILEQAGSMKVVAISPANPVSLCMPAASCDSGYKTAPVNVKAETQTETVNRDGLYLGELSEAGNVSGTCQVRATDVKTSFLAGKVVSLTVASTILKETVSLTCKSHIEEGFSCSGRTSNNTLVILKPGSSVQYWQGGTYVEKPRLSVFPDGGRTISCRQLTMVR